MTQRSVLILGAGGEFGKLFAKLLRQEGMLVSGMDARQTDRPTAELFSRFICSNASEPSEEARAAGREAEWVVSCMPQQATLDALTTMGACMSAGSLFMDILSVKTAVSSLMRSGREDLEYFSIHPMFAPASGFSGQNVAVIRIRPGKHSDHIESLITKWGAYAHHLTPESHDRCTAAIQVATHAAILSFGLALSAMRYDISEAFPISSPPHRTLLAFLARIANGNPDVYWQIQTENPLGDAARLEVISAAKQLQDIVEAGNYETFSGLMRSIRLTLGDANESLLQLAASLTSINSPGSSK